MRKGKSKRGFNCFKHVILKIQIIPELYKKSLNVCKFITNLKLKCTFFIKICYFRVAQGRYKKAVEALMHAKLLSIQPDFMLLYDLARCNANLKHYDLAEESCREAIKICKSKAVYKLLAACLIHQNKIGDAIEVFRFSLRSM